jgi:chromosome segregation ATPase
MTTEARVTTIESQLQQIASNLVMLSNANVSNASHIAGLIEATSANTRAIAEMKGAIEALQQVTSNLAQVISALNERMDRLEQTLEDRTNTILEMIDRQDTKITGLQADVTGLRTEMQRVIEMLGGMQQGS